MRDISYKNVDVCGHTEKVATFENWQQRQIRSRRLATRSEYDRKIEETVQILRVRYNCDTLQPRNIEATRPLLE